MTSSVSLNIWKDEIAIPLDREEEWWEEGFMEGQNLEVVFQTDQVRDAT